MTCSVAARNRCRSAAILLRANPICLGVDVLAPATGPRDTWTLEATFECESVPPGITSTVAQRQLHIVSITNQGPTCRQLIAEVPA